MRTINEQTKTNPVLADKVIEAAKAALKANVWWLDQCFGRAWKITKRINGRNFIDPCIYTTGNSYESLVPSKDLGNFSFFLLGEPSTISTDGLYVDTPYSLIVWCDLRTCFSNGDTNRRDTENLKAELISALGLTASKNGKITLSRVYEEASSIYRGFTLDETINQYLMQPYAGFRIEGGIRTKMPCE